MQTTSFHPLHLSPPYSGSFTCPKRSPGQRKMVSASPLAMKRDANHDHKLVDENMVVLKMRIQEMKMKEEAVRAPAPSDHWMNWEKEWYKNYDSDVYEAVGLLQSLMMNSRPSLVIGIVALLMLSSSLSLVEVLRGLLNIVM